MFQSFYLLKLIPLSIVSLCLNLLLYLHFLHFLSETQSEYEIGPFGARIHRHLGEGGD